MDRPSCSESGGHSEGRVAKTAPVAVIAAAWVVLAAMMVWQRGETGVFLLDFCCYKPPERYAKAAALTWARMHSMVWTFAVLLRILVGTA